MGQWGDTCEPLGEDATRNLYSRLLNRAGITNLAGHDLRRTFATLVRRSSSDEFLTMRLLRDKIPGVGSRYINFPLEELAVALAKYSPLTLGESRTGSALNDTRTGVVEKNAISAIMAAEGVKRCFPTLGIKVMVGHSEQFPNSCLRRRR